MVKTEGATEFIPTPELCEAIKEMAYNGLSQEDISRKIGRDCDTVFINSKEKFPEVYSAYMEGKRANKEDLLRKAADLTDNADSDSVKLSAIKYNLAIKHKVVEVSKSEVDTKLSGEFSLYTSKLKEKERILEQGTKGIDNPKDAV
jgi:transcriptional regulator with XRE-family HTH domain